MHKHVSFERGAPPHCGQACHTQKKHKEYITATPLEGWEAGAGCHLLRKLDLKGGKDFASMRCSFWLAACGHIPGSEAHESIRRTERGELLVGGGGEEPHHASDCSITPLLKL